MTTGEVAPYGDPLAPKRKREGNDEDLVSNGRYQLPHPVTGEKHSWQRVTNFIKVLEDTYGLDSWNERCVAHGVGKVEALTLRAAATPITDKKAYDEIIAEAKGAAGAYDGRNRGSALHAFSDQIDRGQVPFIPGQYGRDMEAYQLLLQRAQITIVPEWIERTGVNLDHDCAGTFDRAGWVGGPPGGSPSNLNILDLKTADKIHYGFQSSAMQFALYADFHSIWDKLLRRYEAMPPVDKRRAWLIHVPAGTGTAALLPVDLNVGRELNATASQVLADRKRGRKAVGKPVHFIDAPAPVVAEQVTIPSSPTVIDLGWDPFAPRPATC